MKNNPKPFRNTLVFLTKIALASFVITSAAIVSTYALATEEFSPLATFQGIPISGVIKDDGGTPLPGVNIIEKGTTNGVATDSDGKYSLLVSGENTVLVISFIGYTTQEVPVNGRSSIDISMSADTQTLE
ncbi:MAG TPA: carboxypeptidase-like regulatory domain-containing protein, partial [Flavitalea sp.]|nr:carboxypeptidase-like regulatory domain-containing protein [Flavitalea sp.]